MGDERDDDPKPIVHADRTMQIDALTDVSLTDGVTEDDEGEEPPDDEPVSMAAPPPLPPKRAAAGPSRGTYVIAAVVVLAMAALGAGIAHVLVPAAAPETPVVAAPTSVPAPEAAPAAEPRRVHIGEIVIGGSAEGSEPPPAEEAAP